MEISTESVTTPETVEVQPESTIVTSTSTTPTDDESRAREQGWVPKEEWTGDPEKWREAKAFNDRGELFQKIDHMGKELKETRKALKMLQEHHTKVKETEYVRAVDELKALQKRHLEEGNSDGYLETSELLTDLKAEQKAREVIGAATPAPVDPRFTEWVGANKWYEKDAEMREYADVVGNGYAQRNPGLDPEDVLVYVSKQVKKQFAEKFVNPNRNKPSAVEGASTGAANKGSFELTEDERKVMNTFVRSGVMSKEEYIAQVKQMKGVK